MIGLYVVVLVMWGVMFCVNFGWLVIVYCVEIFSFFRSKIFEFVKCGCMVFGSDGIEGLCVREGKG